MSSQVATVSKAKERWAEIQNKVVPEAPKQVKEQWTYLSTQYNF
jgi:hypothetical protein